MSRLKLVTFDVRNTFMKVSGSVGHQFSKVAQIYGEDISEDKLNSSFKREWKTHNQLYPNYGFSTAMSGQHWWVDLVKKCFSNAGYKSDAQTLNSISNHVYFHFSDAIAWELMDEPITTFQHIRDEGLKLGIISNFDDRLEKILYDLKVLHYFDFVLTSGTLGIAKPSKDIFQKGLRLAGAEAHQAVHVGDNVNKDYHGAKAAGMHALLVRKVLENDELNKDVCQDLVIAEVGDVIKFIHQH